jgi:hypothetical protein
MLKFSHVMLLDLNSILKRIFIYSAGVVYATKEGTILVKTSCF